MIQLHEITRLTHALPLRERQTALSFLACHAAHFEYPTPREFCIDYGLSVIGIANGDPSALAALAALTGASLDELQKWSPVRLSQNRFSVNGEIHTSFRSPRKMLRGCPLCIKEQIEAFPDLPLDVAVYQRAEDLIGYVTACPTHNVAIVTVRTDDFSPAHGDTVRNFGDLLDLLRCQELIPRGPTNFERYCVDRVLGRKATPSIFDRASMIAVGVVCRALGADLLKGQTKPTTSKEELLRQHFEGGFNAIAGGEATLISPRTSGG